MVLVTGASGFVGKNLIPEITKDRNVKLLVRSTSNIDEFKGLKRIEIVYGDLEHNQGIDAALKAVDVVIHCAARTIGRNFAEYYKTNTIGTENLVKAMERNHVKGMVYLSSHAACGPSLRKNPSDESVKPKPISFYGMTKMFAEDAIRKSQVPYTILRPVAVYGPHDTEILKYIEFMNRGICPIIGFGKKQVNMIYVKDLVQLIIKVIDNGNFSNNTYFVNDGHCYDYDEVVEEIAHVLGKKNLKIHIPEILAALVGLMNDVFVTEKRRTVWRDKVRELAQANWSCSADSISQDLGFVPKYSLTEGLEQTIEWYKSAGFLR